MVEGKTSMPLTCADTGRGWSAGVVGGLRAGNERGNVLPVQNAPDPRVVGLGVAVRGGAAEGAVEGQGGQRGT